jgi:hypothetical protein
MPIEGCPACETGECLEHGENLPPSSPDAGPGDRGGHPVHEDVVTREELHKFRKKVAKSVKRLNRAVKEARRERAEASTGVEPPPEPATPPQKRMSDAAKLGLGVFRSCKRK